MNKIISSHKGANASFKYAAGKKPFAAKAALSGFVFLFLLIPPQTYRAAIGLISKNSQLIFILSTCLLLFAAGVFVYLLNKHIRFWKQIPLATDNNAVGFTKSESKTAVSDSTSKWKRKEESLYQYADGKINTFQLDAFPTGLLTVCNQ